MQQQLKTFCWEGAHGTHLILNLEICAKPCFAVCLKGDQTSRCNIKLIYGGTTFSLHQIQRLRTLECFKCILIYLLEAKALLKFDCRRMVSSYNLVLALQPVTESVLLFLIF